MRHQKSIAPDSYHKVDVAAIWPIGPQLVPLAVPDIEAPDGRPPVRPAAAAPDVPVAVGKLIVAAYGALIAAFAFATIGSGHSIFMITISALFLVAFFTVPRIILGVEPENGTRPSLGDFLESGIDTLTGHNSGKAALVQILIVPVFLTLAALAMGIAASFTF